jgi:hypothetical protein
MLADQYNQSIFVGQKEMLDESDAFNYKSRPFLLSTVSSSIFKVTITPKYCIRECQS